MSHITWSVPRARTRQAWRHESRLAEPSNGLSLQQWLSAAHAALQVSSADSLPQGSTGNTKTGDDGDTGGETGGVVCNSEGGGAVGGDRVRRAASVVGGSKSGRGGVVGGFEGGFGGGFKGWLDKGGKSGGEGGGLEGSGDWVDGSGVDHGGVRELAAMQLTRMP